MRSDIRGGLPGAISRGRRCRRPKTLIARVVDARRIFRRTSSALGYLSVSSSPPFTPSSRTSVATPVAIRRAISKRRRLLDRPRALAAASLSTPRRHAARSRRPTPSATGSLRRASSTTTRTTITTTTTAAATIRQQPDGTTAEHEDQGDAETDVRHRSSLRIKRRARSNVRFDHKIEGCWPAA